MTRVRRGGAQIGRDQQFLEFLQRLIVEPTLPEDRGNAFGNLLRATRKPSFRREKKPPSAISLPPPSACPSSRR